MASANFSTAKAILERDQEKRNATETAIGSERERKGEAINSLGTCRTRPSWRRRCVLARVDGYGCIGYEGRALLRLPEAGATRLESNNLATRYHGHERRGSRAHSTEKRERESACRPSLTCTRGSRDRSSAGPERQGAQPTCRSRPGFWRRAAAG